MKRAMAVCMVAVATLAMTVACAEEKRLASVDAGEAAWGDWTARAAFETAELGWEATVRIEGPGTLTLCYPGDGKMALKKIAGPTEEPRTVRLHMRANPDAGDGPWILPAKWHFEAGEEPAVCWLEPSGGAPMPDDFALQPEPLYQHQIPRVDEPPVIDGDLSDPCWNDEAYIGDATWGMYNRPGDAKMATWVWCAYDDENLYAAFRCETPDVDDLVAKIAERDGYAWRDDSAEIFFDIGHDHDTYYEYIVTPKGVVFDSKWFYEGGQWLTDWDYIGDWETATEPGAWIVEIRLALESYEKRDLRGNPTGEMPLPTGDIAGILFSRNDRVVGEGMSHADLAPSFHEVHQYGHLVGFKPNRVEAYRATALDEVERLERHWRGMDLDAGTPPPISVRGEDLVGTEGLPEAIADLRARAEAGSPSFDEWVAINKEIDRLDGWLDRARALLAPVAAARRWSDQPWGLGVAEPSDPGASPAWSSTLHVPDRLELRAARGETVPVQLAVFPRDDVREVSVFEAGLVGGGGLLDDIEWYRLAEMGRLIPQESVPTDDAGYLWWEIAVPIDAEPGVYEGQIVTTDGEHDVALPVELTVDDFALPKSPSLAVSAAFDGAQVMEEWYGERSPLGAGEYWPYAQALLDHGIVPREMLADYTWWGDDGIDLGGANRMLMRAWDYAPDMRAMIAARPEHLEDLRNPRQALRRAVDHWEDVTDIYPIRTWVPAGDAPPDLGRRQRNGSVAAAVPGMDREPIAEIATWALDPRIAGGFGGCPGAELSAAAGAAGVAKAWQLTGPLTLMDIRMLGWLADDRGVDRLFWDIIDAGPLCASGLLYSAHDGERLVEPHPTVALKLLREAVQDYEYLRILREINSATGPFDFPDRLWRLRLAQATQYRRNWDMVMNVRDFNRDPRRLAARNAELADQIVRGRRWLQRVGAEGPLPGDPTR